ncbi:MAG: carboxypeptidase-like regulatory domain-containing protein [Candidatus Electryonea clarkiae]|nr:carboxypeptidase-like regulatory domain-containing protein [Candidatus Electryonea clarkiae]MDP8288447.1 carboxypeptidase-like regulatory domain-containing protein [Candidatus Electryonea clarkiae]
MKYLNPALLVFMLITFSAQAAQESELKLVLIGGAVDFNFNKNRDPRIIFGHESQLRQFYDDPWNAPPQNRHEMVGKYVGVQVAIKDVLFPVWVKEYEYFYFLLWAQESVTITAKAARYEFVEITKSVPSPRNGSFYSKIAINPEITHRSTKPWPPDFKDEDRMMHGSVVPGNKGKNVRWILGNISESETGKRLDDAIIFPTSDYRDKNYKEKTYCNIDGNFIFDCEYATSYRLLIYRLGYKPVAKVVFPQKEWGVPLPEDWLNIQMVRIENNSDKRRNVACGFVLDRRTQEPIAGVEVELKMKDKPTIRTVTDSSGFYYCEGQAALTTHLNLTHPDYEYRFYPQKIMNNKDYYTGELSIKYDCYLMKPKAENIPEPEFVTVSNILAYPTLIRGRVINSITVKSIPAAIVVVKNLGRYAVAMPDGTYQLHGIPPGNYSIEVDAPGFESISDSLSIPEDGEDELIIVKDFNLVPEKSLSF